jgi:adenylate cyclase class 2
MAGSGSELEVKFYLGETPQAHARLVSRLEALGAAVSQPRVLETNLRFDRPDGELQVERKVLRLRQDALAHLTYKGPGVVLDGVQNRVELEFTVSDFDQAQQFLQALGYQVVVVYEKYRATYTLDTVLVTLDEMPFGCFAEIEGPDGESIRLAAQQLNLDWEKRIFTSYLGLFEALRAALNFTFRDLTFANFASIPVPATLWESLNTG